MAIDDPATQKLPENGSWRNPAVRYDAAQSPLSRPAAAGYPEPASPRPYPRQRCAPRFVGFRVFLSLILALVSLLSGAAGGFAYWAQKNLVEAEGFSAISNSMAEDSEFQGELATAVTDDLMQQDSVTSYLGDGNAGGFFGGIQNWAYEQIKTGVDSAAHSVVQSENYPDTWNQVLADTHAYNFDSSNQEPAALNLSALYSEVDRQAGSVLGFDPNISGSGQHLISLESENSTAIHSGLLGLAQFAAGWQTYLIISLLALVLAFLLWPRGRFYFAAVTVGIAALLTLATPALADALAAAASPANISTRVGQVFLNELSAKLAESLVSFASSLTLPLGIAAAVLCVIGLAVQISRLSARATTASA